jgi:hypothetical protein
MQSALHRQSLARTEQLVRSKVLALLAVLHCTCDTKKQQGLDDGLLELALGARATLNVRYGRSVEGRMS